AFIGSWHVLRGTTQVHEIAAIRASRVRCRCARISNVRFLPRCGRDRRSGRPFVQALIRDISLAAPAARTMRAVPKVKTQFLCNHCGSVHPKWFGKCPDCGTWDSLEEYKPPTPDARKPSGLVGGSAPADLTHGADALTLPEIDANDAPRTPTGI